MAKVEKGELITQLSATRCQPYPFNLFFHWSDLRKWCFHLYTKTHWAASPSTPWPIQPQALVSFPPKHRQNLSIALLLHCHHPGRDTTTSLVDACSSFSLSACSNPCPLVSILHPTARVSFSKCRSNGSLSCCKTSRVLWSSWVKVLSSWDPGSSPATLTTAQPQWPHFVSP